jgi:hypothetical protein
MRGTATVTQTLIPTFRERHFVELQIARADGGCVAAAGALLSGCLPVMAAKTAVGVTGAVVGAGAKATGAVVGAVIPHGDKKGD